MTQKAKHNKRGEAKEEAVPMDACQTSDRDDGEWVQRFIKLYQVLNADNLFLLDKMYHPDIVFTDPLHSIHGRDALTTYFAGLYQNLTYIRFDIHNVVQSRGTACLEWTMEYAHKQVNKGQKILVHGVTWLEFHELITRHRDYFDAGEMLYQHLPLMGMAIRAVKKRMAV